MNYVSKYSKLYGTKDEYQLRFEAYIKSKAKFNAFNFLEIKEQED